MEILKKATGIARTVAGQILKTIVLLVVLNGGLGLYHYMRAPHGGAEEAWYRRWFPIARQNIQSLYPSMTEADVAQLAKETKYRPLSPQWFTGFGEAPFHGKYLNISEYGFRMGTNQAPWPPVHDGRNFVVFLFGGSTAFGYLVTDDQALGSVLQPMLEKNLGRPVSLYNFGQEGYFSTQERILFEQLILSGRRPDLAIFLDGLNDFHNPAAELPYNSEAEPPSPLPETWGNWLREGVRIMPMTKLAVSVREKFQSVAHSKPAVATSTAFEVAKKPKYDDPGMLQKGIDRYLLNKQLIEAEARELKIGTLFVWQPVPLYEYDLKYDPFATPDMGDFNYSEYGYPMMRDMVERTHPDNFLWCADLQKDSHELLYVDLVHYSPKMMGMVAGCIADGVK